MAPSRIENLRFRSELLRHVRQFFYDKHFCEVQTPILSADTIVDCHIEPLTVAQHLPLNHHGTRNYYLQTSPEFAMKRLLTEGMSPIFQITPVFRAGDRGPFHNVEFTMLEWYRLDDDYQAGMQLLAELVRFLFNAMPAHLPEIECQTYRHVFESNIGINPHTATIAELQAFCDSRQIAYPDRRERPETSPGANWGDSLDDWLDLLFSEVVQPTLESAIVYDYPFSQPHLATIRQDGGDAVSERFELFLNGLEIASGYHELRDAAELRLRFRANGDRRLAEGRSALPIESRLLQAMERGFPQCSGTALGIDRLLMMMLNAERIDDVLAFPIETA
ncbi:MAG: EF-P lysine aminoacylase EpmA [Planctomycetaceae bacterium]|nr:EF-P lysine aminoacylase EpmA [Planctomycetaceae bacterium]